jgi:maintenance of morphology protein 1
VGNSAPRLFNAQIIPNDSNDPSQSGSSHRIQIDASYTDSISLRLTTSLFFNQPVPFFARLPVSLSLTLNVLRATISIVPPARDAPEPVLMLRLEPDLELSLETQSLLGSRAKLANVPKIHELIENRIKRALVDKGTWRIHLPMHKEPA